MLLAAYSFTFAGAVLLWLPASPRWLTLRGRTSEASEIWEKLGVPSADREKIMHQREAVMVVESDNNEAGGENSSGIANPAPAGLLGHGQPVKSNKAKALVLGLFAPDTRSRLFLAVFLMGMQQLSGIDGVLYYAPVLFQQAGLSSAKASFLASGVSAIVIFAVSIPAMIFADRWSRRANTILGGIGMGITMFLMGGLYAGGAVHADSGAGRWIIVASIYVFAIIFSISWAVVIRIYAAEIQPQKTRAAATSLAHGSNWLSNFLVALVTPTLLARTSYGAYFLFGSCSVVTALVCWAFMPETRGKSLDEIEQAFYDTRGSRRGLKAFGTVLRRKLPWGMPPAIDA
ncbi:uncharacterized protein THITE_2122379 [Thermothielavioides terrestris NRRL 8126]|uniref:Major facilitator superfamily (MFS) profile domain-containing protein n=2 Tax=Thermothielavioides terrestris TaxID=2587410 RepID=G2RD02_THETT|nr:uncharacterized protein THITE_2122379 [Thermothielavioides terrestris NRRL 8126]AEO70695.1 hypothetical protein THITE_2122379 [Thermothielavioides terrestris NRRL 8126]